MTSRLFLLASAVSSQFTIQPVNNTIGIYYHEKRILKISNEQWTLIVYKDLQSVNSALKHNRKILENKNSMLDRGNPKMTSFKAGVMTHVALLTQISESLSLKYQELFADMKSYERRSKRGLINGIGSIWKSITGNLDASDGEYFNDCINKITHDEHQVENLIKKQISVTTSVIKNFNSTIQKLQIDEEIFNKDIQQIEKSIFNLSDKLSYFDSQLRLFEICESLMESYLFLENSINDIINSITFARLKILHSSIITSKDLIDSLRKVSQSLHKNNLPLPISSSNVAQYLDIRELQAYQTESKIVFILKLPLVEPESYTLYRLYPMPLLDNRTGLHHILVTSIKYIARDDDSLLYVSLQDLSSCMTITSRTKICRDILPYSIDSDSICEAQLLKHLGNVPKTCQSTLLFGKEYNIQEIDNNIWLIAVSDPLPITIKCAEREPHSKIIKTNSLLQLQPACSSFVGSTRLHSKYLVDTYKNITYDNHPVEIPYSCCDHLPSRHELPKLKPLKMNKINVDDLDVAQHQLNQYSEELNKIINQPFVPVKNFPCELQFYNQHQHNTNLF